MRAFRATSARVHHRRAALAVLGPSAATTPATRRRAVRLPVDVGVTANAANAATAVDAVPSRLAVLPTRLQGVVGVVHVTAGLLPGHVVRLPTLVAGPILDAIVPVLGKVVVATIPRLGRRDDGPTARASASSLRALLAQDSSSVSLYMLWFGIKMP